MHGHVLGIVNRKRKNAVLLQKCTLTITDPRTHVEDMDTELANTIT